MRRFDLLLRHFLDHLILRNCSIGVTADCGQHVPSVGAHEVDGRQAAAGFVVPADTGLRAGMALEGSAQIPFECAAVVTRHTKSHRIHDANQLFCIGIARTGGGQKFFAGLGKFSGLHQLACIRDIGMRRRDKAKKQRGHRKNACFHLFVAFILVSAAFPNVARAGANISADGTYAKTVRTNVPEPLTKADFRQVDMKKARLGRLLFYDSILSGNRNISCATCHAIEHGTSDGLSLGIGQGGQGVGPLRKAANRDKVRKRIPRNSPALWNLGAKEITTLFHDGRLSVSDRYGNGFDSPAEEWLPQGLDNVLASQALFPLTSQFEMAGNPKENEVAGAAYDRIDNVWPILAKRVRTIPTYNAGFIDAFENVRWPLDITIVHIANALAAFISFEWQSYDSPFDAFLAGDDGAFSAQQKRGLNIFYGEGNCGSCHSGKLLTDHKFHALALPHFGPGRTRRFDPHVRDVGRMGETDRLEDAYRFRTSSLRNVELTAPYGHNGAYRTLEGIIRHHLDPAGSFDRWQPQEAALRPIPWISDVDFVSFKDRRERARLRAQVDIEPVALTDHEIEALVAFLKSLTGTDSVNGRLGKPYSVPSGLPMD